MLSLSLLYLLVEIVPSTAMYTDLQCQNTVLTGCGQSIICSIQRGYNHFLQACYNDLLTSLLLLVELTMTMTTARPCLPEGGHRERHAHCFLLHPNNWPYMYLFVIICRHALPSCLLRAVGMELSQRCISSHRAISNYHAREGVRAVHFAHLGLRHRGHLLVDHPTGAYRLCKSKPKFQRQEQGMDPHENVPAAEVGPTDEVSCRLRSSHDRHCDEARGVHRVKPRAGDFSFNLDEWRKCPHLCNSLRGVCVVSLSLSFDCLCLFVFVFPSLSLSLSWSWS